MNDRSTHDENGPDESGARATDETERRRGQAEAVLAKLPMIGPITWLYSQSPAHRHYFFADIEWLLMPPMVLNQGKLFMKGETPLAWVSWAFLDEETERRLLAGETRLAPREWKSGERLWILDLVTPFGGAEGVIKELREKVFPTRTLRRLLPGGAGERPKAVEWKAVREEP